jgi:HSP20 family protein
MMYRSLFPRDVFSMLERLERDVLQAFELTPSIRGRARGGFPAINVGGTPRSVEVYVFAPGLDPSSIDVELEKGLLTVAGERTRELPEQEEKHTLHIDERFSGRFRRVLSLPEDIDPDTIDAQYRDGVLHITVQRKEAAQPRRITVH